MPQKYRWETKTPSQIKRLAESGNYLDAALELHFRKEQRDLNFWEVNTRLQHRKKNMLKLWPVAGDPTLRKLIEELNFEESGRTIHAQNKLTVDTLTVAQAQLPSPAERVEFALLLEDFAAHCAGKKYMITLNDKPYYSATAQELYEAVVRQYDRPPAEARRD